MKAVVVGSMNCMPTEYAILLRKYCGSVVHYHDGGKYDSLSNPTIRWGKYSSTKTMGLTLRKLHFRHYLTFLLPNIFHKRLLAVLTDADLVVLSGPSISLARFLKGAHRKVVALSYGSDISLFCNPAWPTMAMPTSNSISAVIGSRLQFLKSAFVKMQTAGLQNCTHYSYFIQGFDPATDALLEHILEIPTRPKRLPRYSINPGDLSVDDNDNPLKHLNASYKLLFPVRFSENELLGNKGWRTLFEGLKKYQSLSTKSFVCICFTKGAFSEAQAVAKNIGIADHLEWHEVVPFATLQQYYKYADVVIEQLGSHWIGQGLYAMALGKPVIGKVSTKAQSKFFEGSGLLPVEDATTLAMQLLHCESSEFRAEIGNHSRIFVRTRAAIEPEFNSWELI